MSVKKVYENIYGDLTWTGTDEIWSTTEALWTDDVVVVAEKLVKVGGSRGGVRKQYDTWNAWNKLNEKDKKKIVKVIVYLKTGVKLESKVDVNKYEITVDDIDLFLEEYKKYKITVSDVEIREK